MRLLAVLLMVPVLFLGLGGCLEVKEAVVLKADGSGVLTGVYTGDLKKLKELIDMVKMLYPQQAGAEPRPDVLPNPFDRSWFEQSAKPVKGVSVTHGTTEESDGIRMSTIRTTFTSLQAAARGGAFFASTVKLEPYKGKRVPGPRSDPKAPVTTGGDEKAGGEAEGTDDDAVDRPKAWKLTLTEAYLRTMGGMEPKQVLPAFEAQLSTAQISRTFTLPAKVIETNGTLADDGRTVTWSVNYKKIIAGDDITMVVVFENTAEMKLEAFSHDPDVLTLMPRFTEPPPSARKPAKKPEPSKPEQPKDK